MKKAAIYVRVSTTEQETGLQENELREFAERRGWQYQIFTDSRPERSEGQQGCFESAAAAVAEKEI
jgi:DNA invertase Pin-like site-specific DNA recombinase